MKTLTKKEEEFALRDVVPPCVFWDISEKENLLDLFLRLFKDKICIKRTKC